MSTIEQDYWKQQVSGVWGTDVVPPATPRRAASAFLRAEENLVLVSETVKCLGAAAQRHHVDAYAIVLTAFNLLQHASSSDRAVAVGCLLEVGGSATAGANLLPLVSRFAEKSTCSELLRDAQTSLNDALRYGRASLDAVQSWTGYACMLNPTALFQCALVAQDLGSLGANRFTCSDAQVEEWRAELLEREIVVYIRGEAEGRLSLRFNYDSELWHPADIAALAKDCLSLLNALVGERDLSLKELLCPMTGPREPCDCASAMAPGSCATFSARQLSAVNRELAQISSLKDAAAIVERSTGMPTLAAFAVSTGGTVSLESVRRHLAQRLPAFLLPSTLTLLEQLPRTASGELECSRLRTDQSMPAAEGAALSKAERYLVQVWCDVLGVDTVPLDGHFIELGGHSVLATQVVSRIYKDLGLSHAVRDVFNHPILSDFASLLKEAVFEEAPAPDGAAASMEVFEL